MNNDELDIEELEKQEDERIKNKTNPPEMLRFGITPVKKIKKKFQQAKE